MTAIKIVFAKRRKKSKHSISVKPQSGWLAISRRALSQVSGPPCQGPLRLREGCCFSSFCRVHRSHNPFYTKDALWGSTSSGAQWADCCPWQRRMLLLDLQKLWTPMSQTIFVFVCPGWEAGLWDVVNFARVCVISHTWNRIILVYIICS